MLDPIHLIVYDKNGDILKDDNGEHNTFTSIPECTKYLFNKFNVKVSNINKVLNGERKLSNGYSFKYSN